VDGAADAGSGTRTLLRYQHPAWGEYAAATEADYGQGRAMYVGFLPQKR
jgi:beta-galactosidase